MDIVRGAPLAGAERPPVYDVVAPQRGELLDVTYLDDYVLGVDCHWVIDPATKAGQSALCYRHEGECPHCGKHRHLWLGFVAVFSHLKKKRDVLRLARESVKALAAAVAPAKTLRGHRHVISRGSQGRTGSLTFAAHKDSPTRDAPKAHDVGPTVCMLLGCDAIPGYVYTAKELREGGVS